MKGLSKEEVALMLQIIQAYHAVSLSVCVCVFVGGRVCVCGWVWVWVSGCGGEWVGDCVSLTVYFLLLSCSTLSLSRDRPFFQSMLGCTA